MSSQLPLRETHLRPILAAAATVRTPPNPTSASASFPLPNKSPHNANKRFWPIVTYWVNGVLRVVGWAG
jgi:hypothetical protein